MTIQRRHWIAVAPNVEGPAGSLFDLLKQEPWMEDALCAETDPDAFFPEPGGNWRPAKQMCGRCDVREECLRYALEHNEPDGIWGGLTRLERRALKPAYVGPPRGRHSKPAEDAA